MSNRSGRQPEPIPEPIRIEILNDIKVYNIGYKVIKNKYGFSQIKLNKNGIFTTRLPVQYINSLKVNKIDSVKYDICDLRDKKILWVDQSDLSNKSLKEANKHSRVIKINGLQFKLVIATTGLKSVLIVNEQETSGELKELWSNIIFKAIKNGLDFDYIALDSQAKFNDSPKTIIRVKKNDKHPYNSLVEGKIRQLKNLFYGLPNIEELKTVDQIKNMIYKLWEFIDFQEKTIKTITVKISVSNGNNN